MTGRTLMVCRNCGAGIVRNLIGSGWEHVGQNLPDCPLLEPMDRELYEGMVRNIEAYLTREKK